MVLCCQSGTSEKPSTEHLVYLSNIWYMSNFGASRGRCPFGALETQVTRVFSKTHTQNHGTPTADLRPVVSSGGNALPMASPNLVKMNAVIASRSTLARGFILSKGCELATPILSKGNCEDSGYLPSELPCPEAPIRLIEGPPTASFSTNPQRPPGC